MAMWRRPDPAAVAMVQECEAFLAGAYAELMLDRDAPVPVWAWMNLLAHGTEDQLRACAHTAPSLHRWRQARAYLAGELVNLVDRGALCLPEFQSQVLIPLELDVMDCPASQSWSPGQLARGLLGTLPESSGHRR
jgi:hypothetical protein